MGKKRKTYTNDFKEDAVRYYRSSGLKLSHNAKELGVDHSTLSRWGIKSLITRMLFPVRVTRETERWQD